MRGDIDAFESVSATGFSKESITERLAHVGNHSSTRKGVNGSFIVSRREDNIISEDINLVTVFTITTLDAGSNQGVEDKALNGKC
jgi:hypothetical protein